MRVGVRLLGFALLGCATVLPAQDPPASPETELVVIGRKMRLVRLDYSMNGRWVRNCQATRSSGDPRIDRLMCAMLRSCVGEGHRDVGPAKQCINRRLDALDAEGARIAASAAPAQPSPSPSPFPMKPQARPVPKPSEIVVVGDRKPPDIVVSGPQPTMRGGLWRFARSGGGPPFGFTMCLPDGAVEAMLRQVAGEQSQNPMHPKCSRLHMAFTDGRIAGRRSCTIGGGLDPAASSGRPGLSLELKRSVLTLSGRLEPRQMVLNFNMDVSASQSQTVAAGAAWNPQRPEWYRWRILGNRLGECSVTRRRDQRTTDEAVQRMFGHRANDDDPLG